MFLDENHLRIKKNEQDIFLAYEIIQMKPLFDRDETYLRFINKNLWIKKILPNAFSDNYYKKMKTVKNNRKCLLLLLLERILKKFQLYYMRNKRTTEVIKEGVIKFHKINHRKTIIEKFHRQLNQYKIKI
jgi:hypothetical protein